MAKFILGTKQHMTQIFEEDGKAQPATILSVGPVTVTQVRDEKKDKYKAVQVGYQKRSEKGKTKPELGHTKKSGPFQFIREFRVDSADVKEGDTIDVSLFEKGEKITISATSKGKGFQGVVKRHGFHGGPRSHGQKHSEREPGSIGATGPQRVFKGVRMGGRMGSDRVTVKNLVVLAVDTENNLLFVRGAVPGKRGTLVEVRGK